MSQRIALTHRIEQRFERRVQLSTHWLRVRPAPHARGVTAYSLKVNAEPHFVNWLRDPYENHIARLDLPDPLFALGLNIDLVAQVEPVNPFAYLTEPYASNFPFDYPEQLRKELVPYLRVEAPGPRLSAWLAGLDRKPKYVTEQIGALNLRINERFPATLPAAPGWMNVETLLERGHGTAWESAWLLTLSLRGLGLAARFTSGYRIFLSETDDVPDYACLHAWAEVYLPGGGWIGLDPAQGLFTAEGHLPLASAPEPLRTLPVLGYRECCTDEWGESITLRRLDPLPEAWPFRDETWTDIDTVGASIGAGLSSRSIDLRVGMGLSFISSLNPGSPEWTTAALGTEKRQVGEDLLLGLASRLAPGAVLQLSQGEWYGGEALPRWRIGAFFRTDGLPAWRNPELSGWRRRVLGVSMQDARLFAETLARALNLPAGRVMPAYEDGLYQLWSSRVAIDWMPSAEDLRDPERRRSLANSLSADRGAPAGFVLPLHWDTVRGCWVSAAWSFRRGGLFLMPGESPLGYRLPLEALPVTQSRAPMHERCQSEERPPLPEVYGELNVRFTILGPTVETPAEADAESSDAELPRTALAVQVREGRLYVFLPPLTHLEHYLDLLGAVEAAAAETGIPVVLEGYDPPEDHRLRRIWAEPEPGLLKLRLPDAPVWEAQRDWLAAAYEEAESLGLSAERILSDGSRRPPGGGAELILGGANPMDSPFLTQPELLRSLIVYWQRHPCLSYLLAGRQIGADGHAPRPDEGREDALYELAIALQRIPQGRNAFPWVPDRLLRHLLADPAGDMRRAEIRLDQLYAPDRPSLRLGKIVLRSFESLPERRLMSLAVLLVSGVLAMLDRFPRDVSSLRDFGPALRDRLLLPRVLWDDFLEVLRDLHVAGFPVQAEWFEPILNLRFPVLGGTQIGDVTLELRAAHEPWPLLAEEVTAGGVARFVDSANERVQVLCAGLSPARHALLCNGFRVPLEESGVRGEFFAGVRYKVWNPPSTLHPMVPPIHSLVFDLVDTWTGRVLGGCTYFPPRPGALWGATSLSARLPASDWMQRRTQPRETPRLIQTAAPPWGVGGRFLPEGSAPGVAPTPRLLEDRLHPSLLDLTRTDH